MAEQVDYSYKPENSGGGKYLNLAKKDDSCVIRLVTKPISYFIHWVDNKTVACPDKDNCQVCAELGALSAEEKKLKVNADRKRKQMFVWGVIDRADETAKVFKAGVGVFLDICTYAQDPEWGGKEVDASKFDVRITRTEESPAKYYSVVGIPSSLAKPLTAEEQAAVDKITEIIDNVAIAAEASVEVDNAAEAVEKETPSTENPKSPEAFQESLGAEAIKDAVDPGPVSGLKKS